MRKFMLLMLVAVAGLAVPAAHADQPTRIPVTFIDFVDTTCGFPVSFHFVLDAATLTVFSNGDAIGTGRLSVEFSANDKTVSRNVAGPIFITTNQDGSVSIRGAGVNDGRLQTADGVILAFFAGPVTVDPSTNLPTLEHGRVLLDICAALAP
jgi:hypothetical protein